MAFWQQQWLQMFSELEVYAGRGGLLAPLLTLSVHQEPAGGQPPYGRWAPQCLPEGEADAKGQHTWSTSTLAWEIHLCEYGASLLESKQRYLCKSHRF